MEWHEREMEEDRMEWENRKRERDRESDKVMGMKGCWERVGGNGKQEERKKKIESQIKG
jgi:hypothetical protein